MKKKPSEMTHKTYVKYLSTLDDNELRFELKTTIRWANRPFIREAYEKLDDHRKQIFIKTAAKDYFYSSYIKKFYPFELIYDVLQYKINHKDLRDIWYYLKDILKHIDIYRFFGILNSAENSELFLNMFPCEYHYIIFSDLLNGKSLNEIVVRHFKNLCSASLWYIAGRGKSYREDFFNLILCEKFKDYFKVEDYKMNPKCLYCLLLYGENFLTEEEHNKVLKYFKNTINYKNTYLRDYNFDILSQEDKKELESSIFIKTLLK